MFSSSSSSCSPCADTYWGSATQFISYELTGFLVGGITAGVLAFSMSGEVTRLKERLSIQVAESKIASWFIDKNYFKIESYSQKIQDIKVASMKGAVLGLVMGGACFAVQAFSQKIFCMGQST